VHGVYVRCVVVAVGGGLLGDRGRLWRR